MLVDAVSGGMLAFRNGLVAFFPKIKKVAGLAEVVILPDEKGGYTHSFTFVGRWDYPERGEYTRTFTRELVFGHYLQAVSPIPVKRPCDVKSEIIRDITNRRLRA